MVVVIIAGGKGIRLRPYTLTVPKPMLLLGRKPILEHIINYYKKYNLSEFIITLGYKPKTIIRYFGNGEKIGVKIRYFHENRKPLGTAGGLASIAEINEDFIVTYADVLRRANLRKILQKHKNSQALATVVIYRNTSQKPKSMIIIDKFGYIKKFIERPQNKSFTKRAVWSNASLYVFSPEIFDYIAKNQKQDFGRDVFPKILSSGKKIRAYIQRGNFIDLGTKEKLISAGNQLDKFG